MKEILIFSNALYFLAIIIFLYVGVVLGRRNPLVGCLLIFGVFLMAGPVVVITLLVDLSRMGNFPPWWMESFSFVSPLGHLMIAISFFLTIRKINLGIADH